MPSFIHSIILSGAPQVDDDTPLHILPHHQRLGGLGHVVWPHLNVGQPQRLSTSSTSAMVLPGSRAATLPTVSKSNLMLPAAEGVDCEGLMKARRLSSHLLENT